MSINVQIVDQRVQALAEKFAAEFEERLGIRDEDKRRSAAFVLLVVKTLLDLPEDEALDCLTEGGDDFGVDAIHIGDVHDTEFAVTIIQGKYKKKLDGLSHFPENGVTKIIQTVRYLFDPYIPIQINPNLAPNVEEIRSRVRDGFIPQVRVVLCNNGMRWTDSAEMLVEAASREFGNQVQFDYANHDRLIGILMATKSVDDSLQLTGKAIVEEFDFRRVLIGKIFVHELANLFDRHGDRLLERNIRRYLGLSGNRVNQAIRETLLNPAEQGNFYFYNNGITMICNKFSHSALQGGNFVVRVQGMQVINGGQTCKTIQQALSMPLQFDVTATVLLRLYELPDNEQTVITNITSATNSQNPVDLRDLRSNDDRQRKLEKSAAELGYRYIRQRSETGWQPTDITSATAAMAIMAVWREKPHQAKFRANQHFDSQFYHTIFTDDLNAAQMIVATLIFRFTENKRRRPPAGAPPFLPYASCFLSMLMGRDLLREMNITLKQLDHRNFAEAKQLLDQCEEEYFARALRRIRDALDALYQPTQMVSLQQLSATFRRGDLIATLMPDHNAP